jgi:hypothetical protein
MLNRACALCDCVSTPYVPGVCSSAQGPRGGARPRMRYARSMHAASWQAARRPGAATIKPKATFRPSPSRPRAGGSTGACGFDSWPGIIP